MKDLLLEVMKLNKNNKHWTKVFTTEHPMLYLFSQNYYIKVYEKDSDTAILGAISTINDKLLDTIHCHTDVDAVNTTITVLVHRQKSML